MKNKWFELLNLILAPVLLMVLGIILIVNPDSASALVAKVLAWALILVGTGLGLRNLLDGTGRSVGQIVAAAICLVLGLWLLANPLVLAKSIGRVLGLVVFLQAIDLRDRGRHMTPGSLVTAILGLILVLVPMTTSRILFIVLGIVLLVIGVTELVGRLRGRKLLDGGKDPNIIDVDKA